LTHRPHALSRSLPRRLRLSAGLCLALSLGLGLGGCSLFAPPVQQHGIKVDADDLQQLVIGTSTRDDVAAALGSPTMKASFDENTWIYISERTYLRVGQKPGMEDLQVVTVSFDDKGVLRGIRHLGEADSQPVTMTAGRTDSPGTEASFMQQLLGNIGKFTPGLGATDTPGGVGPAGGGISGMH
jgi:outer membrane protein assembly factor BamE (lipoprotein component of BamABCDE complex)